MLPGFHRLSSTLVAAFLTLAGCATQPTRPAQPDNSSWQVVKLWPGQAPGRFTVEQAETRIIEDQKWREIVVLKDVVEPSVTVIRPPRPNGASMIVLPGGAFGALAWDVEGTEVGEFLAERGITAFILKYRVRTPSLKLLSAEGFGSYFDTAKALAAADAEQAVRYVRANAKQYGLNAHRVGMVGFSAGGLTTLRVLKDAGPDARPDIAASVYGLLQEGTRPESTPLFIAVAKDDLVDQARSIESVWSRAGAPSELHIFESGGHGFGLGRPGTGSMAFRKVFGDWLKRQNFTHG